MGFIKSLFICIFAIASIVIAMALINVVGIITFLLFKVMLILLLASTIYAVFHVLFVREKRGL